MAFKLPKTEMSWSEPYFFLLKLRVWKSWMVRGLIALGIALVMFGVIQINRNQAQKLGLLNAILVSAAAGLVLVAYADCGNIQREVSIYDDSIVYNSAVNMGIYWHGSFEFKDIRQVLLMRPGEWEWPYGGMLIHTSDDVFLLAIPHNVSLDTVANVLHRLGVQTLLSGWEPSESDTRVQVTDEVAVRQTPAKFAGVARIWDVAPEDGPLVPTMGHVMSFVVGLWPLVLALMGAIGAAVYVIVKWSAHSWVEKSIIGGVAFAAVIAGFMHLIFVGQFLANRMTINAGRQTLRTRPNALLSADDDSLLPVEVFDRAAWTSTLVQSVDYGFLQVDKSRGVLRFEGKKQRWEIPATAISACRIEEARVGSEANENPEKRYYVVIASTSNGEPWEAGMTMTRTELGNDGSQQRYERAQRLLGKIGAAVSA